MVDSDYRKDENYYPKEFLEKYNYITIEEKMSISNDDIEIYFDDSVVKSSDDSDEENSNRKIRMRKISCINLFQKKQGKYDKFLFKKIEIL